MSPGPSEIPRHDWVLPAVHRKLLHGTGPLTDLLKKGTKWAWSDACEEAFNHVKPLLCASPILRAPDFTPPFVLKVDVSRVGVGAVLLQEGEGSMEHPVAFFSKKLSPAKRNYSVTEQELLALLLAMQHFKVYLPAHGPVIKVYSDHHPLQFLNKFKFKNQRLTRWSLLLQEYHLDVRHIKGTENVLADCLSRVEVSGSRPLQKFCLATKLFP